MKSIELQLTKLEESCQRPATQPTRSELEAGRAPGSPSCERSYDKFLREIEVYSDKMTEEERTHPPHRPRLRRVRGGGAEVHHRRGGPLHQEVAGRPAAPATPSSATRTAGYRNVVVQAMLDQHLPPQFYYVVLQESDFKVDVCGPETRWGIAKGPWQLIPSTAIAYGLKTGPLYLVRQPDPRDERHDFREGDGRRGALPARHLLQGGAGVRAARRRVVQLGRERGARADPRACRRTRGERNFWRLLGRPPPQHPARDLPLRVPRSSPPR